MPQPELDVNNLLKRYKAEMSDVTEQLIIKNAYVDQLVGTIELLDQVLEEKDTQIAELRRQVAEVTEPVEAKPGKRANGRTHDTDDSQ